MYSLIISTIAYPFVAWWMHRRLEDTLEAGAARKLLVVIAASVVCWAIGAGIDWAFPGQAMHLL